VSHLVRVVAAAATVCCSSLLFAGPASAWQAGTDGGVISITADPGEANRVDIDVAPDGRIVVTDDVGAPRVLGAGCVQPVDETTASCDRAGVTRVVIDTGDLDDAVTVGELGVPITVRGGSGNDTISTGASDDVLDGGSGNDTIDGGAGNDTLTGGDGDDQLSAGGGDDVIDAGAGSDTADGDTGDDRLTGGDGDDQVSAGIGSDTIEAGAGTDTVDGDVGDDRIIGGDGSDQLDAGPGNDTITAGGGDDQVSGGDGGDTISGGDGRDRISGDDGADTIDGGTGNDDADGGAGTDSVHGGDGDDLLQATDGTDALSGGAGNDRLEGNDLANTLDGGDGDDSINAYGGADRITGGAGADTIDGGPGPDAISGGDGRDRLSYDGSPQGVRVSLNGVADDGTVGEGDDVLADVEVVTGSSQDDVLVAGPNAVQLNGGGGNDRLTGSPFSDVLDGGVGDDTLDGGAGGDILTGGDGSDTVSYAARTIPVIVTVGASGGDGQKGEYDDVRGDVERVIGSTKGDTLSAAPDLAIRFDGGAGPDRITLPSIGPDADAAARRVVCGTGTDTVIASRGDVVSGDCDIVTIAGRLTRFMVQGENSPRLRVVTSRVRIAPDGRLLVPVYCAAESGVRCITGVHVDRAFRSIGRASATVGRGRTVTIRVPLRRTAAAKLRRSGGAVRLSLKVRDKSGARATGKANVAVKVPASASRSTAGR
jgi:Ca2+-binding RTX toxin-like protein